MDVKKKRDLTEGLIIGHALIYGGNMNLIAKKLSKDHFLSDKKRKVFECCSAMMKKSAHINVYTVADQLERDGLLKEVGLSYLKVMANSVRDNMDLADLCDDLIHLCKEDGFIEKPKKVKSVKAPFKEPIDDSQQRVFVEESDFK